jgi:hypothetical protein
LSKPFLLQHNYATRCNTILQHVPSSNAPASSASGVNRETLQEQEGKMRRKEKHPKPSCVAA